MGFIRDLFKDNNDINEKSVIGFLSFFVMVIVIFIDIFSDFTGHEVTVNEFIYNSFVYVTLVSLGIASVDKFFIIKNGIKDIDKIKEDSPDDESSVK